jgi:hypothetical protein
MMIIVLITMKLYWDCSQKAAVTRTGADPEMLVPVPGYSR